jgi:hypothetical protein
MQRQQPPQRICQPRPVQEALPLPLLLLLLAS